MMMKRLTGVYCACLLFVVTNNVQASGINFSDGSDGASVYESRGDSLRNALNCSGVQLFARRFLSSERSSRAILRCYVRFEYASY